MMQKLVDELLAEAQENSRGYALFEEIREVYEQCKKEGCWMTHLSERQTRLVN